MISSHRQQDCMRRREVGTWIEKKKRRVYVVQRHTGEVWKNNSTLIQVTLLSFEMLTNQLGTVIDNQVCPYATTF